MKEQVGVATGKFITVSIIVILVSCAVSATVCSPARAASMWSKTFGGTGTDSGGGDVVQTIDGGYAMSGDTDSFGAGAADYWLIKTDIAGNTQWNKTYGGPLAESESAMFQTSDGGFALLGMTSSFGAGGQDFWFVKTDANGNVQWNKTYGGTGNDYGFSVVQTSDGGYACSGTTNSFGAGNMDFWLVKTDAAGNMQWNKTYGGTGNDYGSYGVVQSPTDRGYALGGSTNSFGAGNLDYWLVKTDADGNVQWNKTYGGTAADTVLRLIRTVDGYAIVGVTGSFGAGGQDVWLVKADTAGNMQWNKTYGGTGNDAGTYVVQTGEGGLAIVGYTGSFGAGGQDFWLIKTDATGNMQWNQTYGGTGNDQSSSMVQTTDRGYAMLGYTLSFGAGGQDFYFVKTDEVGVIPDIPEFSSWLIPSLALAATGFIVIGKKRLLRTR